MVETVNQDYVIVLENKIKETKTQIGITEEITKQVQLKVDKVYQEAVQQLFVPQPVDVTIIEGYTLKKSKAYNSTHPHNYSWP